jgi:S-formylglutathione hydrolase FrmB
MSNQRTYRTFENGGATKGISGKVLWLTIILGAAAFLHVRAQAANNAPEQTGSIKKIKVHGASLEGNLEGDPAERDVFVYLPPRYAANRNQRYPVVYLLHGYGRVGEQWVSFIGLPGSMDNGIAKGTTKEMIVVIPDANTKYGGSMYSSSPTTGDWETYITHDLVSYIDSHYRTVATREGRGLGGHSMGGYGVWRIAMKHPELYAIIYAMSPCCLMNNPQPRPGNARAPAGPPQNAAAVIDVASGEAAAWSPNPQNPPLFFDRPVVDGKLQPAIAAKWVANSPLAVVDQYVTNLKKYDAIAMDVGLQDTLIGSIREMDQSLTRLQIAHVFETFEGDHSNHLKDRIEFKVLPFFSEHLAFKRTKK